MKNTLRSTSRALCFALCGLMVPTTGRAAEPLNLPIAFDLEKASTVTVVIEDAAGKRVRNLIAAARLAPGRNLLSWDGYDEGETQPDGSTSVGAGCTASPCRRQACSRKASDSTGGKVKTRGDASGGPRRFRIFNSSLSAPPARSASRSGAVVGRCCAAHSRSTKAGPSCA